MEGLSSLGTTLRLLPAGLVVIVLIHRLCSLPGTVPTWPCSSRSCTVLCKTSRGVLQGRARQGTLPLLQCGVCRTVRTFRSLLSLLDCTPFRSLNADSAICSGDWAAPSPAGENTMPSAISDSKSIEVTTPTGSQTIANPLYRYYFNPLDSSQLPEFPVSGLSDPLIPQLSLTLSSSVLGNIR